MRDESKAIMVAWEAPEVSEMAIQEEAPHYLLTAGFPRGSLEIFSWEMDCEYTNNAALQ